MIRVLAALAGAMLLAGCAVSAAPVAGGSAPAAPGASDAASAPALSAPGAGACALVTEAEAATALGADPGPGAETSSYDATSCVFGTYPQMITVSLAPSAGKAGFDRLHTPPTVGTMVELSGLGDAAFRIINEPVATVEFLHGDAVVAIVVVADGSQDRAVELAKAANGRL